MTMQCTIGVTVLGSVLLLFLLHPGGGGAQGGSSLKDGRAATKRDSVFISSIPTNFVRDAVRAEQLAAQRVKWTPELRERVDRFLVAAAKRSADWALISNLEGIRARLGAAGLSGRVRSYEPVCSFVEENCYAIVPLLTNANASVREHVIVYFRRAIRLERDYLLKEELGSDEESSILKGIHDPPWVKEVLDPLIARSMFDRSNKVRDLPTSLYRVRNGGGMNGALALAGLARAQGTNEWAMAQWLRLYPDHHAQTMRSDHIETNLIPPELCEEVVAMWAAREAEAEEVMRGFREGMRRRDMDKNTPNTEESLKWKGPQVPESDKVGPRE